MEKYYVQRIHYPLHHLKLQIGNISFSYIHIAFSICPGGHVNDELDKIEIKWKEKSFSEKFINRLLYQYKFPNYNNQEYAKTSTKFYKIKFIPKLVKKLKYN